DYALSKHECSADYRQGEKSDHGSILHQLPRGLRNIGTREVSPDTALTCAKQEGRVLLRPERTLTRQA
ncbi:hypothetical protein KUCAC02_029544, partial [Chaenocephalus aceratus]